MTDILSDSGLRSEPLGQFVSAFFGTDYTCNADGNPRQNTDRSRVGFSTNLCPQLSILYVVLVVCSWSSNSNVLLGKSEDPNLLLIRLEASA